MSIIGKVLGTSDIIKEIGTTIREFIPDKDLKENLEFKLQELDNQLLQGQLAINKVEASNSNLFVAGWRPAMGWASVSVVVYTYILAPFLKFGFDLAGYNVPLPTLDLDALWPVILGMLGLGAQRSYDKSKGVASSVGGVVHTPKKPVEIQEANTPLPPKIKKKGGWFK